MTVFLIASALIALSYAGYRFLSRSSDFKKTSPGTRNADLIKVLLNLEEDPLAELFVLYRREFGASAARYARHTYRKWQAGKVRPNQQTFERFLIHLPQVMSFDLKCEVLRELRETYCASDNYEVTVYTDDWKETLAPLVKDIIVKADSAELPALLEKRLKWLAGDDMEFAGVILARSQTSETLDSLARLEQEFSNIEQLLDNAHGSAKVTHELRLPLGRINLNIKRR